VKLKAIIPGAAEGISAFRRSKFSAIYSDDEFDTDEEGNSWPRVIGREMPRIKALRDPKNYRSGMFKQYFLSESKCKFEGHIPRPSGRKNHMPTCERCYFILWELGSGWGWTPELEKEKYGDDLRTYCTKPGCRGYRGPIGLCIGGKCMWTRIRKMRENRGEV